jgi:RHS repeat-associated protein
VCTYDLAGNAASETQNLGGVNTTDGLAGGQTQYFSYDAANRLTASHFSGSVPKARSYTYDANGNRTSVTEGNVTFAYTYDATDELRTKSAEGGPSDTFTYDSLGNLLTSQPSGPGDGTLVETTYTYDPAGHLLTIAAAGSPTVSFSIDALGRHKSQTISGTQTTYAYLGTSNSITTLTAASTTYSIIDAVGNRLATSSAGVTGYLVPDLHGNVAASVATGSSPSFLSAFRYDAYGETCDSYNAGGNNLAVPWRYQGRIRESASSATDLYDFGARSYDPSLGAFTSFDSVSGSAMNPLSLNRYLYALANPASLIDPSGHDPCYANSPESAAICKEHEAEHAAVEKTQSYACAQSGNRAAGCDWNGSSSRPAHVPGAKRNDCTVTSANYDDCGNNYSATVAAMADAHFRCAVDSSDLDRCYRKADLGTTSRPSRGIGGQKTPRPDCQGNIFCQINNNIGDLGDWAAPNRDAIGTTAVVGGSAALCALGWWFTFGAACLPALGVTVITGANGANNFLSGRDFLEGWTWEDAAVAGITTTIMGTPAGIGLKVAGGAVFGAGSELISEQVEYPGSVPNVPKILCAGIGGGVSGGLSETKYVKELVKNEPLQGFVWELLNATGATTVCDKVGK